MTLYTSANIPFDEQNGRVEGLHLLPLALAESPPQTFDGDLRRPRSEVLLKSSNAIEAGSFRKTLDLSELVECSIGVDGEHSDRASTR
jgi:hypothetical protein